ncbi:hypothetical protein H7I77_25230 [Mycolicibacterium novocastrense]|uniref:ATP:cob(I)alamin adenosyltransferase n=1 Tax=Mycolicibacterium novocastrense TaxID=59813 RepID=A0AAW5SSS2_MYCNV|nr:MULTISPECIES: hypothetical protein [Mycolicibacterium]MCV7026615.1 hypothetical protein [Mycolicibacterium novocastrense]MDX1887487.1 hypothetical protein [Mycolicibacterium sp. 120270]GAT07634.1 ATP:cob(I)alamin adenosyltransferase [Mycolicibacterium novocastrense]
MGEPTSQPSGALVNLNAVVAYALTLPIADSDRAQLQSVQTELSRLADQVATILGNYDPEVIRQRPDTRFLEELRPLGTLSRPSRR